MTNEWKQKWKQIARKAVWLVLNPRFLLCFGLGWMITNGWCYICFAVGTWLGIGWLTAVASGYMALLWVPFTPEKIITLTLAIMLLKFLFPNDQKTLGMLHEMHVAAKRKWREFREKHSKKNASPAIRLSVLMENTALHEGMKAEHGLSLYLQTQKHRILFDMGQTDAFARNAEQMGVDLSQVDVAVLSHGHYDHGGGLKYFLERNAAAPVYLSRQAFGAYYHGCDKYIGLDETLKGNDRLRFVDEELRIDEQLALYSCNTRTCTRAIEPFGLTVHTEDGFEPECFAHEQYLLIEEEGRRILLSGCAHKGVVNLVRWFEPDVLIGGFHLMKLDPDTEAGRAALDDVAQELLKTRTQYYTGHCTGDAAYQYLKQKMGDRLQAIHAGQTLDV